MSFGAASFGAAAQRGRALPGGAPCPCGGGTFGECCGPILAGAPAATAEQLMRSRFTAFALGDAAHLRATWHPSTAPEDLDLAGSSLRWDRLEIIDTQDGGVGDRRGVVEFDAHWTDTATHERGSLHERSRFRHAGGRWFYQDGDILDEGDP